MVTIAQTPLVPPDMSSLRRSLENLSFTSSYLLINEAAVEHVGVGLYVESSEGHGGRHQESADEHGHGGGWHDQPVVVDVDAVALLQER